MLSEERSGLLLLPGGSGRAATAVAAGPAPRARDVVQADHCFAHQLPGDQRQHRLGFGRERRRVDARAAAERLHRRTKVGPGAGLLVKGDAALARVAARLAAGEGVGQFLASDLAGTERPVLVGRSRGRRRCSGLAG
jgi:hypothetical protein